MMCIVQCAKTKRNQKEKNVLIKECLTATNGVRNVWTTDGRILYKKKKNSISLQKTKLVSGIETLR